VTIIQLTPSGRGAVATLRVEGPGAVEAVESLFRARGGRRLGELPPDRIVVGRIGASLGPACQRAVARSGEKSDDREPRLRGSSPESDPPPGDAGEEVVVCRRGQQAVEIHCHGGLAAVAAIEEALVAAGCRPMSWRQWACAPSNDPLAAAAIVALAEACTPRTAAILLDQYHGALRRAIAEIQRAIGAGDADRARGQIDLLLSQASLGEHLTRPWRVVLAGRSNVGKSSLMNALVGHSRAIVHAAPGTTRDAVTARTAIDGWPVELCDTAGLRWTEDPIELSGIERARDRLASADLVVLLSDVSVPWSAEDQTLLDQLAQGAAQRAILVHNKCDLPMAAEGRPKGLLASALRGDGIEPLWAAIADRLVPHPPPPGAAVPFTPEQVATVRRLEP
jgi:tRNA modification GTPase